MWAAVKAREYWNTSPSRSARIGWTCPAENARSQRSANANQNRPGRYDRRRRRHGGQIMGEALIEFRNVSKHYHMGDSIIKALDVVSFKIFHGEFVAIVGQSGSGKSTCMNIIGCLDVPTDGMFLINGRNVGEMDKDELSEIRNEMVGFIFQQYNLLPKLNVIENVKVPLMYGGVSKAERQKRATEILTSVGLDDKLKQFPNQLSGGQQQRVSVARALVGNPAILLADEPTGALDSKTGREVLSIFQSLHKAGHTIVLITHDNAIAATAERIIRLEDGQIVYDGPTDRDKLVHPEVAYSEGGAEHESA